MAYDPAVFDVGDGEDQAAELGPDGGGVPARVLVARWTGVESRALRKALRLSVREFGRRLGVSHRQCLSLDPWAGSGTGSVLTPG